MGTSKIFQQSPHDLSVDQISVLAVDDDEFNLEILVEILESYNYQVDTATDGQQACELLDVNPSKYFTVVLDRMMPIMDGMEVLQYMSQHQDLSLIPVIMQTAKATNSDIQDGLDAGVLFYVTKPFDKDTLLSTVGSAVDGYVKYLTLKDEIDRFSDEEMSQTRFELQTLAEASKLATLIAKCCPNPDKVVVGLLELLVNAIEHGNLGIGYKNKTKMQNEHRLMEEINRLLRLPEHRDKKVTVEVMKTAKFISYRIQDEGNGFDHEHYLQMRLDKAMSTHGRGIAIARMMSFDAIEYNSKGNQVTAIVYTQKNEENA